MEVFEVTDPNTGERWTCKSQWHDGERQIWECESTDDRACTVEYPIRPISFRKRTVAEQIDAIEAACARERPEPE